nr:MAG TPA: hypothetical protein [Caudoviricetes sp.]DAP16978.1 MAG TPA: hypothetical protein [Caudoviricetes sp.]DAP43017.1 MAG TPA: hypothetical protein [Caudoviricetes sp.]DAR09983.1 MAG TPA: hypothetical protein [Bacteriophage sp.]DAZ36464.1 MAG TPA: hypothetical protein [Caudoviricetes sp.]
MKDILPNFQLTSLEKSLCRKKNIDVLRILLEFLSLKRQTGINLLRNITSISTVQAFSNIFLQYFLFR